MTKAINSFIMKNGICFELKCGSMATSMVITIMGKLAKRIKDKKVHFLTIIIITWRCLLQPFQSKLLLAALVYISSLRVLFFRRSVLFCKITGLPKGHFFV